MARVALDATRESVFPDIDADVVADLLWALAEPENRLEHVHAISAKGRVELVFFHLVTDPGQAADASERLCRLAIATSPRLRGWRVASIAGEAPLNERRLP